MKQQGFLSLSLPMHISRNRVRSCRGRAIGLLLGVLVLSGCEQDPATEGPANVKSAAAAAVAFLPFTGQAFQVLADDVDGNGLVDVALTSHHEGVTQVFFQREARSFEPGPRVEAVGFHPGQLIRLPGAERRYVMFSEGISLIQVMEPRQDGGLDVVASLSSQAPRMGAAFSCAPASLNLAVAPYGSSELHLLMGFGPVQASAIHVDRLTFRPTLTSAANVIAVDLEGDGIDEVLFVNAMRNRLNMVRCPKDDQPAVIEALWSFGRERNVAIVVSGDIDQDGDMDLIVPDQSESLADHRTAISVLVNDGSARFRHELVSFPGQSKAAGGMTGVRGIAFGTDQDGFSYLLAAGYDQLTLIRFPAGWDGATPEMRTVLLPHRQALPQALLEDVDGDGWLDAIFARLSNEEGGLIIYGHLWEQFAAVTCG